MKKIIISTLMFIATNSYSQTINTLTTLPANPTVNDSVYVLASCIFPSASCSNHTSGYTITGDTINAWALNCLGMLTVICYHTDTFALGHLPAGNYVFHFQLDEGFGTSVCTPGIVAGPDTAYSFNVSLANPVNELSSAENNITLFPNPVSDKLLITFNQKKDKHPCIISIYNVLVTQVDEQTIIPTKNEYSMDVNNYKAGVYFLKISTNNSSSITKFIKQ